MFSLFSSCLFSVLTCFHIILETMILSLQATPAVTGSLFRPKNAFEIEKKKLNIEWGQGKGS